MFKYLLLGLAFALHASVKATVIWDGRVAKTATPASFDKDGPFSSGFVKGPANWSEIVKLGEGTPTTFGDPTISVYINDKSIFNPSGTHPQNGVRRAELIPSKKDKDGLYSGTITYHFSVQPGKALNLLHQYSLVFIEAKSGDHIFTLATGSSFTNANIAKPDATANQLLLKGADSKVVYKTDFAGINNFAVTIDWANNGTMTVYASTGKNDLKLIKTLPNKLFNTSDIDSLHMGLFKYPIGATPDLIAQGIQEPNLDESVIYSGLYAENGNITLKQ